MNIMNTLIPNEVGIWIECCKPNCKKWRYSRDFDDPLAVPKKWYCHMNSDLSANNCSAPERLELDEGEIFVESKFKAGCIVWAKVIGHPWSPAMIDFCPEWETYYWFDKANTNVPSQYNVTFLDGAAITRAWIKSAWIKSFVKNDPSFVLKSKVRGKKLTAQQQKGILKGCEIARAALRLNISQRLKKYNFHSWRLSQRFQNLSTNRAAKSTVPAAGHGSGKESLRSVAGPSGIKKSQTVKNVVQTKEIAVKDQSSNKLSSNLKKPAPLSAKRRLKAANEELPQVKAAPRSSPSQKKSVEEDSQTDTGPSVITESTISVDQRKDDTEGLEDTLSIISEDITDFAEKRDNKRRFTAGGKEVVESRLDGDPTVDINTNKKLSEIDIIEIGDEDVDEIVPNSQPTPPGKDSFEKIDGKRNEDGDNIRNGKQPAKKTEKFGEIVKSFNKFRLDSNPIDFNLQSKMREGKRFEHTEGQKSISENLLRTENRESVTGGSRYLRALSAFTAREPNQLLNATNRKEPRKIATRTTPIPDWISDQEIRRVGELRRFSRQSKLSEEEDNRMYKENRNSFIAEIESAGSSMEIKKLNSNQQSYFTEEQNYEHLLTSDEESFYKENK